MQRAARLKRELHMLSTEPPHGVTCWLVENSVCELEAQVIGQEGTAYHRGVFKLLLHLPERYPFEAPKVRFSTPIYHPNIDTGGRICLDILKPPPSGNWRPSMNISSVLTSILLLMAEPNPDDPLMVEISTEFKQNRAQFARTAGEWTKRFASGENLTATCSTEKRTPSSAPDAKLASSIATPGSGSTSTSGDRHRATNGSALSLRTSATTTAVGAARTETSLRRRQPVAPATLDRPAATTSSAACTAVAGNVTSEPVDRCAESGRVSEPAQCSSPAPPDARQRAAAAAPSEDNVHVIAPAAEPAATARPANVPVECVIIDDSDDDDDGHFKSASSLPERGHGGDVTSRGAPDLKRPHSIADENDDDDDNLEWSEAKRQFCSEDADGSDVVYRSDEDIL